MIQVLVTAVIAILMLMLGANPWAALIGAFLFPYVFELIFPSSS